MSLANLTLEPIGPQNAMIFKAVRLRALQNSPMAFGSTYAKESQLADLDWIQRAEQRNGERSTGCIAMDADLACGIASCYLDEHDETHAHLVSMWGRADPPPARRRPRLVDAMLAWSAARQARTIHLMVTCSNEPAIHFYEGLGFALTGQTEPYPNDPSLLEYEMSRPVLA